MSTAPDPSAASVVLCNELDFDDAGHAYRLGGVVLPSVTQVLKVLPSPYMAVSREKLDEKAALGTDVHLACELLDRDDLDESDEGLALMAHCAPYLDAYRRFKRDTNAEVLLNEQRLYHPKHRYAGTLDRRFRIGGQVWDVDLKTTVALSPAVGVQVAAYSAMLEAHGWPAPDCRGALQLKKDGTYRLQPYSDRTDFLVFLNLLSIHHFIQRHKL